MHWYSAKCATEEEKRPSNPIWTDDITDCIFAKAISSPVEQIILDISTTYYIFVTGKLIQANLAALGYCREPGLWYVSTKFKITSWK